MINVFIAVLSVAILSYPIYKLSKSNNGHKPNKSTNSPICQLVNRNSETAFGNQTCDSHENDSSLRNMSRVVVVGDVHGSYTGLMEILAESGIVTDRNTCEWNTDDEKKYNATTLIQIGDIVDRGPGASDAWHCLAYLQSTQTGGNQIIRMIGNHELWWMMGYFHMINRQTDTREKVLNLVVKMKEEIISGLVVGAHTIQHSNMSILFTHAGIRPNFFEYMKTSLNIESADLIASYINAKLVEDVHNCSGLVPCKLDDELFDSGPDRGGTAIGGPFWTDFKVLTKADSMNQLRNDMLQIVGHTASHCVDGDEDCIRHTSKFSAICVDGGMYLGSRSYLEFTPEGSILAHEKKITAEPWSIRNFSNLCGL